jgi:hypothetical protein
VTEDVSESNQKACTENKADVWRKCEQKFRATRGCGIEVEDIDHRRLDCMSASISNVVTWREPTQMMFTE